MEQVPEQDFLIRRYRDKMSKIVNNNSSILEHVGYRRYLKSYSTYIGIKQRTTGYVLGCL